MNLKVKMIKLMAIAGVISMMISYMIILNKEFCFLPLTLYGFVYEFHCIIKNSIEELKKQESFLEMMHILYM